jgi:hypothetical protein
MAATNKRLLISESRSDSNRCTPCREKPDQHHTYAAHASPCMPGVRFLRVVPVRGNLSHRPNRVGQIHCSREKVLSTPPQFSPNTSIEAVHLSQASVDNRLLGLPAHITGMRSIRSILAHEYQPLGP